jgi:hypothetical protein
MKRTFIHLAALASIAAIAVLAVGWASVTVTEDAFAAPSNEEAIKQLLVLTKTKDLVSGIQDQLKDMMRGGAQQALGGQIPNARQQKAIENMENKMLAVILKELSWEKLEPLYIRLYQETFSKEELDGMLSFYKTSTGQAVVNKMPILMQKAMLLMQESQQGMGSELSKIQQEFISEFKAASK